ncbi:hypothetical protein G6N82_06110 [Altererythrobacter sp. BO-6]|uniref:hypothetical protein n=1 Tax=Altererythrobacter sp. BO-6 TaxID=2604537 RepID=UPI0013E1D3A9|nr:hypothetical protein [Altererythrobacter sp. BO-6]QIG53785.1 hypothetical protein G6N82_06110 [Altererythrobacter sp. BO-6]
MKALAWFIGAVMVVAALRLAVAAGLVLLVILILAALFTQPANTLKALAGLGLFGAFASHPLAGLLLCAAIIFAGALVPRSDK